jgi:nucleotide-binding universal stress UspA family protein
MATRCSERDLVTKTNQGGLMRGTLMCAVTEFADSHDALALGAELSDRLGLRLVLVRAVDEVDAIDEGDYGGSLMEATRQGAQRLASLADEHGVADRAETRVAVGEPAALLGQIAAEEAADVIVVGARARGWRKRLESSIAHELESETPVPVLIAPPRRRRPWSSTATNGGRR